MAKFRFLAFSTDSSSFALKIYGTLKIFLLSVSNNFYIIYIEIICRRACEKKFNSEFPFPPAF